MTDRNNDHRPEPELTDFGFERLPRAEKRARVAEVFDSVAARYDVMNDLMSAGLHRLWKRFAVAKSGLRGGQQALDIAAGSGDVSLGLARRVGSRGSVVVADINSRMLSRGRERLTNAGVVAQVHYVQADAEKLPFRSGSFHCVAIGFGLRNVTDKPAALASMYRVLRPGGRLLVLEFSTPRLGALEPLYDLYSFQVLPRLGQLLVNDTQSYRYLAESIRLHPDQEALKAMMAEQGFARCEYYNLAGGIVALHIGWRV